ncbi:hypothetical protein RA8CHR_00799 [Variovorax sp. RA8]|nr:hypothetical protein RA8CHR_00799 [Variovorax sp. RA8]
MPASFPVQSLKLSIMGLDSLKAGLLLKALGGIPK